MRVESFRDGDGTMVPPGSGPRVQAGRRRAAELRFTPGEAAALLLQTSARTRAQPDPLTRSDAAGRSQRDRRTHHGPFGKD